ncbi:MAG: DUF262 domain-containing protein [Thermoproteota archaeon]
MGVEDVPIQDLLGKIERGEIALPDIQREFVWTNTQVKDFVESIYKKHPVGLILLWEKPYGEEIPVITMGNHTTDDRTYKELVIDGQQRLTSLLLVNKGRLTRGRKTIEIELYFNPIDEEFQLQNPKIKNKPQWFNVTEVINQPITRLVDRERLRNELGLSDDEIYNRIYGKLEELKSQLTKERIPIFKIPSNIDYEEIADIFVKVNSKGTRIRITELLLALLAIKLPGEFKKDLHDFSSDLAEKGWDLNVSVLIRSLIAIATNQGRLQYFRSIAKNISNKDLEKNWTITKDHLNHCIRILEENLGIGNSDILPSEVTLVPLVFYLHQKNGRLTSMEIRHFILWFLLASFWGRYTGQTETRLDDDIKSIIKTKKLAELFVNLKNQVGRLRIDKESFKGRGNDKKLLLYVICREAGAVDWFRGHKITTSDIQEHHIFPRSLLKKKEIEGSLIDDVANIAFLTEKANKSILNKEPIIYIRENKIDEEKLKKQFVPLNEELWKIDNYEQFLEERRGIIVDGINKYFDELDPNIFR